MNHHPDRTACFSVTCTAAKQTQGLSYPTLPGDLCRVFVKHAFSSLPLSRWNTVTHITLEYRYACPHRHLIPVPV